MAQSTSNETPCIAPKTLETLVTHVLSLVLPLEDKYCR